MPRKKPILFEGFGKINVPTVKLPKMPSVGKYILGFDQEEKRVRIPSDTRNAVYKRAKGRCESCGMPMKLSDRGAQFHHTRKPTVKSKPSTIQFLCATCHRRYGHEKYTVTKPKPYGLGTVKESKIKRKKVGKHTSPYRKTKTKTAKKKTTKTKKRKTTRKRKTKRRTR
jgi:hypothetical protein